MSFIMQNYGIQDHGFEYRQEARARLFNRLLFDLIPPGIYSGLEINRVSDTQIEITPGVCFIKDNAVSDETIAVRVRTTQAQGIDVSNTSKPYIVLRFGWSDAEDNYMTMGAVGFSDNPGETDDTLILPNDLIVGKILYDGSVVKSSGYADYSRRSRAVLPHQVTKYNEFKVSPSETYPKRVYISSGIIRTSKGTITKAGSNFPTSDITDTTTEGRNDIIWIDENGDFQITYGTPAAVPETPEYKNKFVIAEIKRGASRTEILGTDIVQVKDTSRKGMISAADFLIADSDGYYTEDNVEAALKEIYEIASGIEGDLTDHINATSVHGAVSTDTASRIIIRDANGRAQVSAPAADADIARKFEVDTVQGNLTDHEELDASVSEVHGINIVTEITEIN